MILAKRSPSVQPWRPKAPHFLSWSPGVMQFLARSPGALNPFGTDYVFLENSFNASNKLSAVHFIRSIVCADVLRVAYHNFLEHYLWNHRIKNSSSRYILIICYYIVMLYCYYIPNPATFLRRLSYPGAEFIGTAFTFTWKNENFPSYVFTFFMKPRICH